MIKNMFTLLSTSDNGSDVEVKCDNIHHSVSDWETDEFKIKEDKENVERKKDSVILPFKGVECVPLNSVKEEDFPKLGASLPIPSKESIKSRKGRKKNTITFTVDRSYIAQNRHERSYLYRPNHCGSHDDPRTAAFSKMEDKEAVAKSLSCTRACKNVLQKQESGEYGVCLRHVCTFAHSLEELNDPMCGFDATCRFRHGRPRRDGTVDSNGKCMFLHSDETREDWLKRTGRKLPALPATSEKTRKPTPMEDKVKALPQYLLPEIINIINEYVPDMYYIFDKNVVVAIQSDEEKDISWIKDYPNVKTLYLNSFKGKLPNLQGIPLRKVYMNRMIQEVIRASRECLSKQ